MLISFDSSLLTEPQFFGLRQRVGPGALFYLVSLWDYCTNHARSDKLYGVTPETIELICQWDGEPGRLYEALLEGFHKSPGWIQVIKKNQKKRYIKVTHWAKWNKRAAASQQNGKKGGRPRKGRHLPKMPATQRMHLN